MEALLELLPGLRPWLRDCGWVCDVATFSVEIARCANFVREGVVLIGDSFRTSCPAVGTGLSCAMVDVLRLRDHVAEWLKTPGMGREKIVAFYNDPIKRARDESTHELAFRAARPSTRFRERTSSIGRRISPSEACAIDWDCARDAQE